MITTQISYIIQNFQKYISIKNMSNKKQIDSNTLLLNLYLQTDWFTI